MLSVHVTSVLFLVRFNNFALTVGFYWSYTLLLLSPVLMHSCAGYILLDNRVEQEGYELQTLFSVVQELVHIFYTDYSATY